MAELPSGTVTFLFTDLEGSTRLWEAYPDAMRTALARHDEILRGAVESHGGYVVKTTGDGLHAVFAIAPAATAAAVEAQQRLLAEVWPLGEDLRVRMGLHTGHAEIRDGDYYGPAVNRAARVAAAPHGGQIVVSHATEQLVRDTLPAGCALVELGEHQLRDLGRAEVLFQVVHADLPREFARLRASGARKRRSSTLARWAAVGVVLGVAAVGGVIVASSGGGDQNGASAVPRPPYTPRLTDRACTSEESAGDPTVRCQTLAVPEDRSEPRGRTVRLAVIRAPATDTEANPIPTISIGPTVSRADQDALRAASPTIRLGVRGREGSTPQLSCPEFDTSRAERWAMPWNDAGARYNADLLACLERLRGSDVDLSQYDQGDIADDVRDLAFASKQPRISLVTTSTFTRAAMVVIRRYPGLLASVVMNDPQVPPTTTLGGVPGRFDESLALLAQRCTDNTACRTALPGGLVASIDALRERLATNPQTVTVSTPNGPTPVLVDDGLLMVTLALAIGTGPPTLAVIPSVAANSDPTAIAAYFAGGFQNFETTSALFVIEACADAAQVSQSLLEAQAAALPRWRTLVNTAYLDLCEKFDLHQVSDLTTAPASAIPVFVIRGALTPSSTRVDLSTFAAGLTHYSLLELPNESGSLASPPPCVQTLRMAFLRNPTTPLDTKTCAAADPPIPFPVS